MEVKELSADMAFCLACPVCGERSCMATFELCQHIISVHIHDDHDRSRMVSVSHLTHLISRMSVIQNMHVNRPFPSLKIPHN